MRGRIVTPSACSGRATIRGVASNCEVMAEPGVRVGPLLVALNPLLRRTDGDLLVLFVASTPRHTFLRRRSRLTSPAATESLLLPRAVSMSLIATRSEMTAIASAINEPLRHLLRAVCIPVAIASLVSSTTACGDDEPVGPESNVESVELVPAIVYLEVGGTTTLEFTARDAEGDPVDGVTPKWETSDATKASISGSGLLTALSNGSAQVSVSIGAHKATSTVTIVAGTPPANAWGVDLEGLTEVSLLGVWAASPTSVFAAGQDGVILRWTGSDWSTMETPTRETIVGIWGTSESNVFAVGSSGVILRYDGTQWSPMASGTSATLLDVWGLDETHVYAVGTGGTMLRYDGTQWSTMPNSAGPTEIWAVWGSSPTNLVAAGQNGVLLHSDGTSWTAKTSPVGTALFGVWGSGPNDVYAVGVQGSLLHYDGAAWQVVAESHS